MSGTRSLPRDAQPPRWWALVGIAIIVLVFPSYCVMTLVYCAPVLVIHTLRPATGEPATVPALFFVLAVGLHPAHVLWLAAGDWATAWSLATDPRRVCADYAAAAFAWVIVDLTAVVMRMIHHQQRTAEGARLRAAASALREEWQIPDTASTPPPA